VSASDVIAYATRDAVMLDALPSGPIALGSGTSSVCWFDASWATGPGSAHPSPITSGSPV